MSADLDLADIPEVGEAAAIPFFLPPSGLGALELDASDAARDDSAGVSPPTAVMIFEPLAGTERALEGLTDDEGIADGEDEENPPETETAEEVSFRNGVYHEIKRKLNERFGIPLGQIAFAHDADTPEKKAALYEAVNRGSVRVLIGSTGKMGTGVNIQRRLIAEHNVDQPWKPAEKEQREGRVLRQGNIYDQVFLFDYVTEGSFDAYMCQTLESKARFISQITAGEVTARTAEDVGDMVLSLAQVKAIASGNPLVQQRIELEVKLVKLDRLRATHLNNRAQMRDELESLPNEIAAQEARLIGHRLALERREEAPDGETFSMMLKEILDVGGDGGAAKLVTFDKRERAGSHLRLLADLAVERLRDGGGTGVTEYVGTYRGFAIAVHASGSNRFARVSSLFNFQSEVRMYVPGTDAYYVGTIGESNVGITQSMDWQLRHIEDALAQGAGMLAQLRTRLENINQEIDRPWAHAREYRRLRRAYEEMGRALETAGVQVESQTAFAADENETDETDETECGGDDVMNHAASEAETRRNPFTGLEEWAISVAEPFDENAAAHEEADGRGVSLFDALTDGAELSDAGQPETDPFLTDAAEEDGSGLVCESREDPTADVSVDEVSVSDRAPRAAASPLASKGRAQKKKLPKRSEQSRQSALLFG